MAKDESRAMAGDYLLPILDYMQEQKNIAPEMLLDKANIPVALTQKSKRFISQKQFVAFMTHVLQNVNENELIKHLYTDLSITQHGILGLISLCGLSARTTLKAVLRFYRLQTKLIHLEFIEQQPLSTLRVRANGNLGEAEQFTIKMTLLAILKAKQQILGTLEHQEIIDLTFAKGQENHLNDYFVDTNIRFNQAFNQIHLPTQHLDIKLKTAHQTTYDMLHEQCEQALAEIKETDAIHTKVERLLQECRHGFPSLEQMASLLAISSRTLNRQLKKQDLNFQYLLDKERITRSKELLLYTQLNITDIANQLYFSDASHFSKVFKRQMDMTPKKFRQQSSNAEQ